MNLIPKISYPIETYSGQCQVQLPLTYQGDCPFAGQFAMEPSETPLLHLVSDETQPAEGYVLEIEPDKITIKAAAPAGSYYGLQTLFQLLREGQNTLRCGRIQDAPRYGHRGFMLDVSRHFFGIEEVKKILDQCARLKLNWFHWHLSDDQGFRIESKRFPKLNEKGDYYTQNEIREVVAYAAERQIQIIPEIETPGHTRAIIAAYPEYSCSGKPVELATGGGIYKQILCAGSEAVYDFLYELLNEICELFPGQYVHIGGDEAPKDEWKMCPHCQALMEQQGLQNEEELQAYFTAKLVSFLKTKGKTAICWNESLLSGKLEESAVAQYWMEMGPSYSYGEAAKGRRFIFSNFNAFYFDYPHAMVTFRATYEYEPNIQGQPVTGEQVLGLEAPLWTERVAAADVLERQIFPRMLALAENAWSREKDYEDFLKRVAAQEAYWSEMGLAFTPVQAADIHGEEGIQQLMAMLTGLMQMIQGSDMTPEMIQGYMQMGGFMLDAMMQYSYTKEERQRAKQLLEEKMKCL